MACDDCIDEITDLRDDLKDAVKERDEATARVIEVERELLETRSDVADAVNARLM